MPTVNLTFEQIRTAINQLPAEQRRRLLDEAAVSAVGNDAREALRRARGTFRFPPRKRKRLSELLAKGNEGTLTPSESQELDQLVDESEQRTLEMALSVSRASDLP